LFAIGAQIETGRARTCVTANEIGALAALTVSLQFTFVNICALQSFEKSNPKINFKTKI
jgi:hypothetical protein